MWGIFKSAQNWTDITKNYKQLVEQYKQFGYDLVNIKEQLQFYLSVIPVVFLAGAIVHLYFFRKAHSKIAKLQGQKQTMAKQIVFLRQLLEKRIDLLQQHHQQSDQKTQQLISTKNIKESREQQSQEADQISQQKQTIKLYEKYELFLTKTVSQEKF